MLVKEEKKKLENRKKTRIETDAFNRGKAMVAVNKGRKSRNNSAQTEENNVIKQSRRWLERGKRGR